MKLQEFLLDNVKFKELDIEGFVDELGLDFSSLSGDISKSYNREVLSGTLEGLGELLCVSDLLFHETFDVTTHAELSKTIYIGKGSYVYRLEVLCLVSGGEEGSESKDLPITSYEDTFLSYASLESFYTSYNVWIELNEARKQRSLDMHLKLKEDSKLIKEKHRQELLDSMDKIPVELKPSFDYMMSLDRGLVSVNFPMLDLVRSRTHWIHDVKYLENRLDYIIFKVVVFKPKRNGFKSESKSHIKFRYYKEDGLLFMYDYPQALNGLFGFLMSDYIKLFAQHFVDGNLTKLPKLPDWVADAKQRDSDILNGVLKAAGVPTR